MKIYNKRHILANLQYEQSIPNKVILTEQFISYMSTKHVHNLDIPQTLHFIIE